MGKVNSVESGETAFPHRDVASWGFCQAWFNKKETEGAAVEFGTKVRGMMKGGEGAGEQRTFAGYCFGDEGVEEVFGGNVGRLRELKGRWDPEGVFPALEEY